MSEIQPYQFPATGQSVRTVLVDGDPWFVVSDVCAVLALTNPTMASGRVDADDLSTAEVIDSMGRKQNANIVNESGLYEMIFLSRKPEAKAFKRWVTHEVLPTIRKTGRYEAAPRFEIPQTYAGALELAAKQAREIEQRDKALAIAEPKAEAWDVLASAEGDFSVRQAAYVLNRDPSIDTGQNRLFRALREFMLIDRNDVPYAHHAKHVRLRATTYFHERSGEWRTSDQVRITALGLKYLHRRMGGTAPLNLQQPLPLTG